MKIKITKFSYYIKKCKNESYWILLLLIFMFVYVDFSEVQLEKYC